MDLYQASRTKTWLKNWKCSTCQKTLHTYALFGNSHVSNRAFPKGPDPLCQKQFGRHHVQLCWMRPEGGGVISGMGGDSDGDWRRLINSATSLTGSWPPTRSLV